MPLLRHWVPDLAERDVYVCGPRAWTDAVAPRRPAPPASRPSTSTSRPSGGDPDETHRPLAAQHRLRRGAAVRLPHLDLRARPPRPRRRSAPSLATTSSHDHGSGTAPAAGDRQPTAPPPRSPATVAQTRWGPVQVQLTADARARSPTSTVRAVPERQRARTSRSTPTPCRVLVQETLDAQSADIDMVSGATVTSDGLPPVAAVRARPGRAVTAHRPATARYVEHVMGMPISLALRGRHADDDRGARRLGRGAGRAARRRPGLQHLPRRLGGLPARPRRDHRRGLPARGRRGARARRAGPARSRDGAFDVRRPRRAVLDPSGVVKGWAVERAARPLRALPGHRRLPLRRRRPGLPRRRPGLAGLADRHRGPARPDAGCVAVVPVRNGAVATSGPRPPRRPHRRRPHRRRHPTRVASVTVVARRPDLGRHRRHRRLRPGPRRRPLAAHPPAPHRPRRLGRRARPSWWDSPDRAQVSGSAAARCRRGRGRSPGPATATRSASGGSGGRRRRPPPRTGRR